MIKSRLELQLEKLREIGRAPGQPEPHQAKAETSEKPKKANRKRKGE